MDDALVKLIADLRTTATAFVCSGALLEWTGVYDLPWLYYVGVLAGVPALVGLVYLIVGARHG